MIISEITDAEHIAMQFYTYDWFHFYLHSYCSGRKFVCTKNECDGICSIYGDGHYISFDDKRFEFTGQCEYLLAQVRWQTNVMHIFSFPILDLHG